MLMQEAQTNDKFLNSGATVDLFMEEKDQKVVNKIGHGALAVVMRYLMQGIQRGRLPSIVVLSRRKSECPLQDQVGGILAAPEASAPAQSCALRQQRPEEETLLRNLRRV